jgi:excinuclease ABC subunit B
MTKFKLQAKYHPTPDQKRAVNSLVKGVKKGQDYQVLLGVTGSGKTFTMASTIQALQKPALIISHNKTLAAQLYQEFRDFFPENKVSYFVSYYDYYQPEAYIPATDTYIEKDADINETIDKLRLAATTNLLTRSDTIVVASVSCIYNIGSPKEYGSFIFEFSQGMKVEREQITDRLVDLQYERSDFGFQRGTFRLRGNIIDIFPAYLDEAVRIELGSQKIEKISLINPITGKVINTQPAFVLYPAKHYITDPTQNQAVFGQIKKDLHQRVKELQKQGKMLEAQRLSQRVNYDLEMIGEVGYVKGIENYSRYFDGRKPGEPPYSLLDYFGKDWLLFVDESHITFPQIRGMYAGDFSRKQVLIEYGFRLPAAIDNRPLKFEEFMRRIPGFIAVSATPDSWEISMAEGQVVEQLLRPTGIPDPETEIRPVKNQVSDVIAEVKARVKKGQRSLVTTLTKKTAEDLAEYLKSQKIKVQYLHSDVKTLERTDILDDLRRGNYDCLVGVNLLREGLDLPEVSLVAILDADKEGFLRSRVTLIQTMGRAARHVEGKAILYADNITGSISAALKEVSRRREYQLAMNKKHNITPKSIEKPIREKLVEKDEEAQDLATSFPQIEAEALTPMDKKKLLVMLRREMRLAANDLNFELAIQLRNKIRELEK